MLWQVVFSDLRLCSIQKILNFGKADADKNKIGSLLENIARDEYYSCLKKLAAGSGCVPGKTTETTLEYPRSQARQHVAACGGKV